MRAQIKIDNENGLIIMTSSFAKRAALYGTTEYNTLQNVRRDYPTFTVQRRTISTSSNKESYNGLTYEYMEEYIKQNGSEEVYEEYERQILLSKCHSIRYANIKKWFLATFPEVKEFGVVHDENSKDTDTTLLA